MVSSIQTLSIAWSSKELHHQEETLEQVGREIGLTRERVRQIQVDALRRLRDVLRKHGLNGDVLFEELDGA